MTHSAPRVADYMTKSRCSIGATASLEDAWQLMNKAKVHYLPVLSGQKIVGLLRDNTVRATMRMLGSEALTASDVMSPQPAIATPDASLFEVLDDTPYNTYGCTVVQDVKGKIVGMFTPREALTTVHRLAHERH